MTVNDLIPENSILFNAAAYDYYDLKEEKPFQVRIAFRKNPFYSGLMEIWIAEKTENSQSFWLLLDKNEYHAFYIEDNSSDDEEDNGRLVILFFIWSDQTKSQYLAELEANYLVDQN